MRLINESPREIIIKIYLRNIDFYLYVERERERERERESWFEERFLIEGKKKFDL